MSETTEQPTQVFDTAEAERIAAWWTRFRQLRKQREREKASIEAANRARKGEQK